VRLPSPPLLLVTDRRQALRPLGDIVAEACAAGCRWISLREKDLGGPELIRLARSLRPIARRWDARLTLHGSAELAQAADMDGVHLPAGGDASASRAMLGRDALIGLSVHQAAEAARLRPGRLDYLIAGPTYATASKPGYGPALNPSGIATIAGANTIPVIAVGGIEATTVSAVMRSGAAGIAVMGAVMRSTTPGCEIERLLAALTEHLRPVIE
jgi:thiamine-phosphate pyrophosphorylase